MMKKLDRTLGLFLPDYRNSIVSLSNSIFSFFGLKPNGPALDIEEALEGTERVTLFVVDGLSAVLLESHPKFKALKNKGRYYRISSVFPTTTTTAMSSLMTGLPPAKHGILGYSMLCRECGGIVELIKGMVRLPEPLTPGDLLPYPTLFDEALRSGIKCKAFLRKHLIESILTKMFYRDVKVEPFVDLEDLLVRIKNEDATLVSAYWEVIDTVGHFYGPSSVEMRAHIDRLVDAFLKFPMNGKGKNALLVTADHGFIDINGHEMLIEDKKLMNWLYLPPFGDLRATFLLPADEGLRDYLVERYGRRSLIITKREVIEKGLLGGKPSQTASSRLGELILLPKKGYWFDIRLKRKYEMKGAHSGLALEELQVPLLVLRY